MRIARRGESLNAPDSAPSRSRLRFGRIFDRMCEPDPEARPSGSAIGNHAHSVESGSMGFHAILRAAPPPTETSSEACVTAMRLACCLLLALSASAQDRYPVDWRTLEPE